MGNLGPVWRENLRVFVLLFGYRREGSRNNSNLWLLDHFLQFLFLFIKFSDIMKWFLIGS